MIVADSKRKGTLKMIVIGDGGYRGMGNVMTHQLVKLYPLQACPRMCLLVEDVKVQGIHLEQLMSHYITRTAVATVAK